MKYFVTYYDNLLQKFYNETIEAENNEYLIKKFYDYHLEDTEPIINVIIL